MSYKLISTALQANANPKRAEFSLSYFPPQAEQKEDQFYGGSVPSTRKVAKQFANVEKHIIVELLNSPYHEERLCGLMIMRMQLDKALKDEDDKQIQYIKDVYVGSLDAVNHWDLVDESATAILGRILVFEALQNISQQDLQSLTSYNDPANGFPTLDRLIHGSLWHKRISIISQFAFIKAGNLSVPLSVIQMHVDNSHHYIQKACGWILREIGKIDKELLNQFLIKNIKVIKPICLSYALEKHNKEEKSYVRSMRLLNFKG